MRQTETERPALLNQNQAAAMLGISRATMYRLRQLGTIKEVRIPGLKPRYRRADLERLIEGRDP
jgi:excisionase family DNA binding protein